MSSRVLTLVGVAAIAGAVWLAGTGRVAGPAATGHTVAGPTAWVATAHQQGIVGYRDPAVAVSPSGRLVAMSEGRVLRVAPIAGGVDVSAVRGEGQVRHLAWVDDRRILFEDGGARSRWQLHELGVGTRPLWPEATLEGGGATSGMTLAANALRQLSVSPDGAWVAGIAAGAEGLDLWRVRLDGQELWRTEVTAGRPSWPAWASATEIACVLTTAEGDGVSVPCGTPPVVTQPALRISGPIAFAPDGRSVYVGAGNERGFLDLWRITRATGAGELLTATARDAYGPTIARDGTVVYKTQEYRTHLGELVDGAVRPLTTFQAETPWWHPTRPLVSMTYGTWRRQLDDAKYPDIAQEVGVLDVSGALPADQPTEIIAASDSEDQGMAWSPNGRWIAFHSHREMSDDVWLRPAEGGVPDRRITMLGRGAEVGWPRWAPDGKTLLLDGTKDGRSVMFTLGLDQDTGEVTSELSEIGAEGFEITHGEWLPDGKRLTAIAKEGPGRHAVLLLPAAGGTARVLHRFASEHDFPGLSVGPDGASFTFVAPAADGFYQLFSRPLAAGPVAQLTFDPVNKSQPAWSPDGRRLAFTAWRYDAQIWRLAP
ncbi:MAG: PD40 domain-containing protein [Acidobacteria bacterium]|nr:PD40 domain-containing protein [Acidobacteriota bacterium]